MATYNGVGLVPLAAAPPIAAPPADPLTGVELQDPAFAAFLREMQFRESIIEGRRNSKIAALHADQSLSGYQFDQQSSRTVENTNQAYQNRGLFRSGRRLYDNNRNLNLIAQQRLNYDRSVRRNAADITSSAAVQLSDERRNLATERQAARKRLEEKRLNAGI